MRTDVKTGIRLRKNFGRRWKQSDIRNKTAGKAYGRPEKTENAKTQIREKEENLFPKKSNMENQSQEALLLKLRAGRRKIRKPEVGICKKDYSLETGNQNLQRKERTSGRKKQKKRFDPDCSKVIVMFIAVCIAVSVLYG